MDRIAVLGMTEEQRQALSDKLKKKNDQSKTDLQRKGR